MLAKSLQAAAGNAAQANYIEDVFSTYLYTGTGASNPITNGIDLAGKGGLVWAKSRSDATGNRLFDTNRGATKVLISDSTLQETTLADGLTAFNSNGFDIGASSAMNTSASTYASWTFRKQPKFFDVVTYTGTGSNNYVSHNLQSVPGCLIIKRTDTTSDWMVFTRQSDGFYSLWTNTAGLNTTAAATFTGMDAGANDLTSTSFNPQKTGGAGNLYNQSGGTYVAYLFAHNAGGFGLTGTDNVISCGSFTTDGSGNATVNLGYEPQWLLYRRSQTDSNWFMIDTMRGWDMTNRSLLNANLSDAESTAATVIRPTATGFSYTAGSTSSQFIYIAIRRGPMKVPTTGTSVFSPFWQGGGSITNPITTGFPVDMTIATQTNVYSKWFFDRLRSNSTTSYAALTSTSTAAETTGTGAGISFQSNTSIIDQWIQDNRGVYWNFRRAPGFFDEVCYTGNGSTQNVTHNLGVAPELLIVKERGDDTGGWLTYFSGFGVGFYLQLQTTAARVATTSIDPWNNASPAMTSTTFSVGQYDDTNGSGDTYVAYLFATCTGVSKVGAYTGTGAAQTINCGFTAGSRFVLIKRTDDTGDWYVWDSARGIVAGDDPYLLLNTTAAEVTSTDYVDTAATGFELTATAPAAINASGGTFIFLAIA
jgi:hypothetical protein